jgi:uncharacterized LabA/DUF88 family protein
MTKTHQRVAVLIDTQNMYHSAKHIHGARLAFGKIVDAVANGRPIVRTLAYVAKSKTGEEQAFFDALQEAGIELRCKDVQEFASGEKKADWDVGIAVDAIKLAEKVDAIVLMTGDGDFVPLVQYLKEHGIYVEAAAFGESTNAGLRASVDRFFDISTEGREFLMGSRRARGKPGKLDNMAKAALREMPLDKLQEKPPVQPNRPQQKPPEDRPRGGGGRRVRLTY